MREFCAELASSLQGELQLGPLDPFHIPGVGGQHQRLVDVWAHVLFLKVDLHPNDTFARMACCRPGKLRKAVRLRPIMDKWERLGEPGTQLPRLEQRA